MVSDIRVPIPKPGEDLTLYFDEMVDNDGFSMALDYGVAEFDERARLSGVVVTGAEITEAGVAVRYTVSWEAFHACDGKTVGGDQGRLVRGRTDGETWLFETAPFPVSRSTVDEL